MIGIEEQFTALYERYYDSIERYVRRRVGDAIARDLVAEVFVVAWRRFGEVPSEPLPWLYGVARRVLANERRGQQRHEQMVERIAGHTGRLEADHAETVVGQLNAASALSRLSDEDREVLQLAAWEGLTMREAAKAIGCSTTAAAMRLHRARKRLHRELAGETLTAEELSQGYGVIAMEGNR